MRTKTWFVLMGCVLALVLSTQYGLRAESGTLAPEKIGVVSLMTVINGCTAMQSLQLESQKYQLELRTMGMELQSDHAELQTMVAGSDDQLAKLKSAQEKEALLNVRQKYYNDLMDSKQSALMTKLYPEALDAVNKIAEAKGLTLVLEKMQLPSPLEAEMIPMVASNNKVLYAKGCIDITEDVKAAINQ